MASLFVIQGEDQGRRIALDPAAVTSLGRDASNTMRLRDDEVSRRHAELRPRGDGHGFVLVDLESANGTLLNNAKVSSAALAPGDHIKIGRTLLIYSGPAPRSSDELRARMEVRVAATPERSPSAILKRLPPGEGSRVLSASAAPLLATPSDSGSGQKVRLAHLAAVYQATLAVSHVPDLDALLPQVLEAACEATRADRGAILLRPAEPSRPELEVRATWCRHDADFPEEMTISKTIAEFVLGQGQGVLTADAPKDERFAASPSIRDAGIREAICVPVQGRHTTVGVLYVDVRSAGVPHRLNEDQLTLLAAIAHQAGLAVENTQLYEQKIEAERLAAMGRTIATLSHHIKNILQGLKGGSYLIEMGLSNHDEAATRRGWGVLEKNQTKIYNLVMDMLSFSKEREPALEPNRLDETVEEVIELAQARAADLGCELRHVRGPEVGEPARFDADAIHRAVLNLVTNALDAVEGVGTPRVIVTSGRDGESLVVEVSDNGPGIPESDHASIFEAFVSGKGARGTGLGLPVTRKVAREHGGDVAVASTVGAGTTFTLRIPWRSTEEAGP